MSTGTAPRDWDAATYDRVSAPQVEWAGQVLDRLERLHERRPFSLLAVSGGAAANRLLRRELPAWAERHGVDGKNGKWDSHDAMAPTQMSHR